jgi:hypothetical protein
MVCNLRNSSDMDVYIVQAKYLTDMVVDMVLIIYRGYRLVIVCGLSDKISPISNMLATQLAHQ